MELRTEIHYDATDKMWPYWWVIRKGGKFGERLQSGVTQTRRGAERQLKRALKKRKWEKSVVRVVQLPEGSGYGD